jgi:hypothetical protein
MRARRIKTGFYRIGLVIVLTVLSASPVACEVIYPGQFSENVFALSKRFWFTSVALGGLILLLDVCERRLSLATPIAGWLVFSWGLFIFQHPNTRYCIDCSGPTKVEVSQYVLGLVSVLFAWRLWGAWRTRNSN